MLGFWDFKMPKFHVGLIDILRYLTGLSNTHDHSPDSIHVLCFATLFISCANLLFLAALSVAGIAICLVILAPVLILLTPILIPLGMVLFLTIGGLIFAGVSGLVVILSVRWLYNYLNSGNSSSVKIYYVNDRHPSGSDETDNKPAVIIHTSLPVEVC
ncbi:hypothetical protein SUGI_0694110 [Cryptomeria japonica]|uniref:oleosin G-like n=1 Tax=Cryptomeria japonica TaxID=3369 RepID=UPI00241496AF|nr:oleosin G-like [Cryptomeria japonica]GLJ34513.1 hypothetical protein SUGI_0694110 [Cryptomeria japonica]